MILTERQTERFTRLLDAYTRYANDRFRVVPPARLVDRRTGGIAADARCALRRALWDDPVLVDDFCRDNPQGLPLIDLAEVRRWRDAVPYPFFMIGTDASGSAIVDLGDALVAVAGPGVEAAALVPRLPALAEFTLLPFEGLVTFALDLAETPMTFSPAILADIDRRLDPATAAPVVSDSPSFVPYARRFKERLSDRSLELISDRLDTDLLMAGGRAADAEDALPAGVHRGALAGLTDAERARVIDENAKRWRGGERVSGYILNRLDGLAIAGEPTDDLAAVLEAALLKDELLDRARDLGLKRYSALRKPELARAVAAGYAARDEAVDEALRLCTDEQLELFARLRREPGARLTVTRGQAAAMGVAALEPYPPYLALFAHGDDRDPDRDGAYTALVPAAFAAQLTDGLLARAVAERARVGHVLHMTGVLAQMRGIVTVDEVVDQVEAVYGERTTREDAADWIELHADPRHSPDADLRDYGIWVYGEDGAACIIDRELSDDRCEERAVLALRRGRNRVIAREAEDAERTGFIKAASDAFREAYASELDRQLAYRDRFAATLLAERAERAVRGLAPVPKSLADRTFTDFYGELPEAARLRRYLDAHVPDGAHDLNFADDAVDDLIAALPGLDNPEEVMERARGLGLFAVTGNGEDVSALVMALSRALPSWVNGGWSANELYGKAA